MIQSFIILKKKKFTHIFFKYSIPNWECSYHINDLLYVNAKLHVDGIRFIQHLKNKTKKINFWYLNWNTLSYNSVKKYFTQNIFWFLVIVSHQVEDIFTCLILLVFLYYFSYIFNSPVSPSCHSLSSGFGEGHFQSNRCWLLNLINNKEEPKMRKEGFRQEG